MIKVHIQSEDINIINIGQVAKLGKKMTKNIKCCQLIALVHLFPMSQWMLDE